MMGRLRSGRIALLLVSACGPESSNDDGVAGSGSTSSTGVEVGTTGLSSSSTSADASTSTSGPGSSTASSGVELPAECSCRDLVDDGNPSCDDLAATECTGEQLCPTLSAECPRLGPDLYDCHGEYVFDAETMTCVLSALRDRNVGKLYIDMPYGECSIFEGCGTDNFELTITASSKVVGRSCSGPPIGQLSSGSSVYDLAEPTHFDECLGLESTPEQYVCIYQGLSNGDAACGG